MTLGCERPKRVVTSATVRQSMKPVRETWMLHPLCFRMVRVRLLSRSNNDNNNGRSKAYQLHWDRTASVRAAYPLGRVSFFVPNFVRTAKATCDTWSRVTWNRCCTCCGVERAPVSVEIGFRSGGGPAVEPRCRTTPSGPALRLRSNLRPNGPFRPYVERFNSTVVGSAWASHNGAMVREIVRRTGFSNG